MGFGGWRGGVPPSAVSPFPSAVPKIQPCSPLPRSPLHPPTPPHSQQAGEQIAVLNPKTEGGGRRRGCAAALGAHLAPEPGELRGGQETREPPLAAPPSRPPPPPPSRRCLPGFEPSPAEPRAPVETKTDRTAGTAATGSGGPDRGARRGRGPPSGELHKRARPAGSQRGSRAGEEALLTEVLGCRLRGSEAGEGLWGASVVRRRQRRGRLAAGERSRGGALSRPRLLTAWLAPRLTFSAANSAGHGPSLPRHPHPPPRSLLRSLCAPLVPPPRTHSHSPGHPRHYPPIANLGGNAPRVVLLLLLLLRPPPARSLWPSVCLTISRSLCLSLLSELGGKRK